MRACVAPAPADVRRGQACLPAVRCARRRADHAPSTNASAAAPARRQVTCPPRRRLPSSQCQERRAGLTRCAERGGGARCSDALARGSARKAEARGRRGLGPGGSRLHHIAGGRWPAPLRAQCGARGGTRAMDHDSLLAAATMTREDRAGDGGPRTRRGRPTRPERLAPPARRRKPQRKPYGAEHQTFTPGA